MNVSMPASAALPQQGPSLRPQPQRRCLQGLGLGLGPGLGFRFHSGCVDGGRGRAGYWERRGGLLADTPEEFAGRMPELLADERRAAELAVGGIAEGRDRDDREVARGLCGSGAAEAGVRDSAGHLYRYFALYSPPSWAILKSCGSSFKSPDRSANSVLPGKRGAAKSLGSLTKTKGPNSCCLLAKSSA